MLPVAGKRIIPFVQNENEYVDLFENESFKNKILTAVYNDKLYDLIAKPIFRKVSDNFKIVYSGNKGGYKYYCWNSQTRLWEIDSTTYIIFEMTIAAWLSDLYTNFYNYVLQHDVPNNQHSEHQSLISATKKLCDKVSHKSLVNQVVRIIRMKFTIAASTIIMDPILNSDHEVWLPTNDGNLYNILTNNFRPRTKEDCCTCSINAKFLTDDQIVPEDIAFVHNFFNQFMCVENNNYDERNYLYRTIGIYLSGLNRTNMTVFRGSSNSGKSTVCNILIKLAGDLCSIVDSQNLLCGKSNNMKKLNLSKNRLLIGYEISDNHAINEYKLKILTGSDDVVHGNNNLKFSGGMIIHTNKMLNTQNISNESTNRIHIFHTRAKFVHGITKTRKYVNYDSYINENYEAWDYPKVANIEAIMTEQRYLDALFTIICNETRRTYPSLHMTPPPVNVTTPPVNLTLPYKNQIDELFDYNITVKKPIVLPNKSNVIRVQDFYELCKNSGDDISRFGRNMKPWIDLCIIRKEVLIGPKKHPQCYVGFTPKNSTIAELIMNMRN